MRIDLTHAGLTGQMLQRLKLAAQLLASSKITASVREWDGTRCHLAVVLAEDGYGERVREIAERRSIPTLVISTSPAAVGERTWQIAADSTAGNMAVAIQSLIDGLPSRNYKTLLKVSPEQMTSSASAWQPGGTAAAPADDKRALVRLATDPALKGRTVQAEVSGRKLTLRLSESRVFAASMSDLHAATYLLCGTDWTFKAYAAHSTPGNVGEASLSLDVFFLRGALHRPVALPAFPPGSYALKDWPDLGTAPELVDPLRVAKALLRTSMTESELTQSCQLDTVYVSACLWSFFAAGLLSASDGSLLPEIIQSPVEKPFSSLMGRIASHFGLSGWRTKYGDNA